MSKATAKHSVTETNPPLVKPFPTAARVCPRLQYQDSCVQSGAPMMMIVIGNAPMVFEGLYGLGQLQQFTKEDKVGNIQLKRLFLSPLRINIKRKPKYQFMQQMRFPTESLFSRTQFFGRFSTLTKDLLRMHDSSILKTASKDLFAKIYSTLSSPKLYRASG